MPDLTLILFVVAGLAIAGAVVFFLRNKGKDAPAPAVPVPDVAALQAALKQAIDKLHASTPAQTAVIPPVPPESRPIPATLPPESRQPDGTVPMATAPTWQAPPPPWPIDARYLSAAQIAALTPEETGRANMWQQALMSAAMTGNGQNPVPGALMIFRAGYTPSSELNAPLSPVWTAIFAAYNVPVPVPQDPRPWQAAAPRPSDANYDVRLQT